MKRPAGGAGRLGRTTRWGERAVSGRRDSGEMRHRGPSLRINRMLPTQPRGLCDIAHSPPAAVQPCPLKPPCARVSCDGQAAPGHTAGRTRPVPVQEPRGGLGDGGRGARRQRRTTGREAGGDGRRRGAAGGPRAPGLRLARRHQARQRARRDRAGRGRAPGARCRRLDRGLHRLPAAARRRAR